jgi:hypothetical protein
LSSAATQALNSRAAAEKALAAADLAVVTQALARRKAIETGLVSDAAELKAQQAEADMWKGLILIKQEAAQAEADYMKSVEDYNAKKKAADTVRSKLSKAKQETGLSNANLARIKPAYDAIVRP